MKPLFITIIALISISGCSKDNFSQGAGDPGEYNLFFEFSKGGDASHFKEGDIEISGLVKGVNLQTNESLTYEDAGFYTLPIDSLASDSVNTRIFGPFIFSAGWETEEEAGGRGNELFFDRYFLLRYQGEDIDTLRVTDSTKVGYYRHFSFYIDGIKQRVIGKGEEEWAQSGFYYVQVQKDSSQ